MAEHMHATCRTWPDEDDREAGTSVTVHVDTEGHHITWLALSAEVAMLTRDLINHHLAAATPYQLHQLAHHLSTVALAAADRDTDSLTTADLKAAVANRVAAEAAATYQEAHTVSRKPQAQRRADREQAKHDQDHWKAEKAKAEASGKLNDVGRATYDRAIARLQDTIDKNS